MLTYSVWKILFKTNLYLHNLIPKSNLFYIFRYWPLIPSRDRGIYSAHVPINKRSDGRFGSDSCNM